MLLWNLMQTQVLQFISQENFSDLENWALCRWQGDLYKNQTKTIYQYISNDLNGAWPRLGEGNLPQLRREKNHYHQDWRVLYNVLYLWE